jgi:hypothetical protein
MREAMLNQPHAAVFEQQRLLLDEFEQRINYQGATIEALPFVIPSSAPICWQSWPRNISRQPKEEQNRYCCNSYLQYLVKQGNPFKPQVIGKPPHDSECTRPSKNNSDGWISFYYFIYTY